MLRPFSYIRAGSLGEAVKHLASEGARLHAGGTDLLGCLRDHVFEANLWGPRQPFAAILRRKMAATSEGAHLGGPQQIREAAVVGGIDR